MTTKESRSLKTPRSPGTCDVATKVTLELPTCPHATRTTPYPSSSLELGSRNCDGSGLSRRHEELSPGADDTVFEFSSNPWQSSPITQAPRRRTRHRDENDISSAKARRENTKQSQPKEADGHDDPSSTRGKTRGTSSCRETSSIRGSYSDPKLHEMDGSVDGSRTSDGVFDGDKFEESSFEARGLFQSTCMGNITVDSGCQLDSSSVEVDQEPALLHRRQKDDDRMKTPSNLYPVLPSAREGAETDSTAPERTTFSPGRKEETLLVWKCQSCTFVNENALHLTCAMCGGIRETGSSTPPSGESLTPSPSRRCWNCHG
jgi:hypothetical protein